MRERKGARKHGMAKGEDVFRDSLCGLVDEEDRRICLHISYRGLARGKSGMPTVRPRFRPAKDGSQRIRQLQGLAKTAKGSCLCGWAIY